MIYVIVGVLLLVIVGGILAYALGLAVSGMVSVLTGWDPALAGDAFFGFADAIWIWMPLFILLVAFAWESANGQMQRGVDS